MGLNFMTPRIPPMNPHPNRGFKQADRGTLVVAARFLGTFTKKANLCCICEPGSKLLVLGMVIQPLIGNPYNGYINPYYWVDEFIPYCM